MYDDDVGLQNNWNRWYNPRLRRWQTKDPGGFPMGDANLYRLTGNDPLNFTDPTGLIAFPGADYVQTPEGRAAYAEWLRQSMPESAAEGTDQQPGFWNDPFDWAFGGGQDAHIWNIHQTLLDARSDEFGVKRRWASSQPHPHRLQILRFKAGGCPEMDCHCRTLILPTFTSNVTWSVLPRN